MSSDIQVVGTVLQAACFVAGVAGSPGSAPVILTGVVVGHFLFCGCLVRPGWALLKNRKE